MAVYSFGQNGTPLAIDMAHFADMPRQITFRDKSRQCILFEHRAMPVIKPLGRDQCM
jgi:hypothetical protein